MMNLKLLLLLIVIIVCASCKKDSTGNPDNGTYFIKAKIDGREIQYTVNAAGRIENNKVHGDAFNSPTNNFPSFSFDIEASTAIQTDTLYREASTNLIFRYSLAGTETYHSQMGSEMDFSMKLTEINSRQIKGTFSGTIRKASDITASLQVTEGFFVLKR